VLWFLKKAANEVIRPLWPAPAEAGAEVRREMNRLAEASVRYECRRETFVAVAGLAFDAAAREVRP